MFVISTSEVFLPSVADFIFVLLDERVRCPDLLLCQAGIMGQFNHRLQPIFCFPTFTIHMNVHARFFAGEEIEAELSCSKNRRTQAMRSIALQRLITE
jgi:hypothetical protein